MKKIFLIIALVITFNSNAQKKNNPDTLNFESINKTRDKNGLFNSVDLYNACAYAPYNYNRYALGKTLVTEIDFLNISYDHMNMSDGMAYDFNTQIENIKSKFPLLDLSAYQKEFNRFKEQELQRSIAKAKRDSIANEEKIAYRNWQIKKKKIEDSLYKVVTANRQIELDIEREKRRIEDSLLNVKLDKERKIYAANLRKKYGADIAKIMNDGKVKLGWTKKMCIESWGEPEDINTTIVKGLKHEQWVYGIGSYLYFDNGILTAIQN